MQASTVTRCEVQVLQGEWWQRWEAAEYERGGEPQLSAQSGRWRASVGGLSPSASYDIQVRGCNAEGCGPWLPLQIKTSEPPAAPSIVKCMRRWPERLELEWHINDPEGAEVFGCEVHLQGAFCWSAASFGKASGPHRVSGTLWQATLGELTANTAYTLQVRGRNAVGHGEWSTSYQFQTSEPPAAPSSFRCSKRLPDRLSLEWQVADPEGAEVTACDLQVSGSLNWVSASFSEDTEPLRTKDGLWRATVASLAGNTSYIMRVRGRNAAGEGAWVELQCRTSDLPATPHGFKCTKRGATQIQLEWQVDDPDGAQVLGCELWVSGSLAWQAAAFPAGSEPRRDNPFGGRGWRATVGGLAANTDYDLRVRGRNGVGDGPWAQQSFRTSELPAEPFAMHCTQRFADRLLLQWQVVDPEGAEVERCEVHVAGSLSWAPASLEAAKEPRRVRGELWEACLADLTGNTAYEVRICGCNAGGKGKWAQQTFRTSETPPEPTDMTCLHRRPNSLALQWHIEDPEGAAVTGCELLLGGSLSWAPATFEPGESPARLRGGLWQATIAGLVGDTAYDLQVRGRNAAGDGRWARQQQLRTSEVPSEPSGLRCARRLPNRLALEWQVLDPEGAAITCCEVQQRGALSWAAAELEGGTAGPQRVVGSSIWRATVVALSGATAYDFRVRGCNESGQGKWATPQEFRTSDVPTKPVLLQCLKRQPDRLFLEWCVEDPDGAEVVGCEVQVGGSLSWAAPETEAGAEPVRTSGSTTWQVTITGLVGATSYDVRVRGNNMAGVGEWSQQEAFRTSEAPPEPSGLQCAQRLPEELLLEWQVADPEGAEVSHCEVQVRGALSWAPAALEVAGGPARQQGGGWRARLVGLAGATAYEVRVRGCNASGNGQWSLVQLFRTSEAPAKPSELRCTRRLPEQLSIEWDASDPEGAEVTSCEVQLQGSLSWAAAELEGGSAPLRQSGETWAATLVGLVGATPYDIRVRGCNACGEGQWLLWQLRTSDAPPAPSGFRCAQRLPDQLWLEWQVPDPEGAEVTGCEVQVAGAMSWVVATLEEGPHPLRMENGGWRAALVGLQGNTAYDVRVRGCNASGKGAWSQGQFMTSEMPAEPLFLRCSQCLPDKLPLEWEVADPEGSKIVQCEVEVRGSVSWAQASLEQENGALRGEGDRWTATVVGLAGATTYEVRVRGCNSAGGGRWLQERFTTSSLPAAPTGLSCVRQAPKRLDLEWSVASPEGAAVTSCEVQLFGSLMWEAATLDSAGRPTPVEGNDGLWHATVVGLSHDESFSLRVRGINAVGAGAWSAPRQLRTLSGKPDAPFGFQCVPQGAGMLGLSWQVADPEDMKIDTCKVQVLINPSIAAPYWDAAKLLNARQPQRTEGESWSATVTGFAPDTTYTLSVYATNAAGDGRWLRQEIRTFKLPPAPKGLRCAEQRHDCLVLEWEIADPDGAPVSSCEVQVSGALFWQPASLAAQEGGEGPGTARRQEGTIRWRATVVGLQPGSRCDVRVCGRSAVGDGAWEQQSFRTAPRPVAAAQ